MSAVPKKGSIEPPKAAGRMTGWLALVLVVVLFAGGLFGYDQGVISGALPGIKATFSLNLLMVQVVTSWVTLGALLGSLAGGELGDRIGRKRTVVVAGALFTCGAAVQFVAPDAIFLVIGRLIIGAGVGVAAVAAPLYAAELAPAPVRGRFVSGYQMAITIGIFLAYLVNGQLAADANGFRKRKASPSRTSMRSGRRIPDVGSRPTHAPSTPRRTVHGLRRRRGPCRRRHGPDRRLERRAVELAGARRGPEARLHLGSGDQRAGRRRREDALHRSMDARREARPAEAARLERVELPADLHAARRSQPRRRRPPADPAARAGGLRSRPDRPPHPVPVSPRISRQAFPT